ncbi:MAG: NADH-quinone oxidoreductase subunit N [Bacteroidetes bacterium]|nr:NADH-quinone oxidoreductase subunit N [Bacteroidota bacterium]
MKTLYILTALGVIAMLAEMFRFKKFLLPIVLIGLLGAIASSVKDWNTNIHYYNYMMTFDNFAILFTIVLCATAFLWFMMSQNFLDSDPIAIGSSKTDHYALVLFALCGGMIMVSYSNMVMLFLGIEILSIPMYVLAGSRKDSLSSNEASLKYFLMGAFATGFLLFGIALIYGATGTFDLKTLSYFISSSATVPTWKVSGAEPLLYAGILMMLIGLCFKISAVPFHFWAPDVYTGAPTPVTAFMATIVKTAAFAAFLRLFFTCFSGMGSVWMNTIWVLAALTILLGNITAVYQTSVKRMLAYSSISHAGYMLLAILAMNDHSLGSVLFYAAAYSVATIGAFTVLSIIENHQATRNQQPATVTFETLSGLAKQNKFLSFAMTISMLSLAGIPPLAGFFGKYYIFTSALQSGYVWLVLIAVLGSLIGVYYYFRIIIKMYSPSLTDLQAQPTAVEEKGELLSFAEVGWDLRIVLILTILLALLLGIFPDFIIRLI